MPFSRRYKTAGKRYGDYCQIGENNFFKVGLKIRKVSLQ